MIKKSLSTILLLLVVTTAMAKVCQHDSQCGVQPYAYCHNGAEDCSQVQLGVSISDDKVYYVEVCRAPDDEYAVKGQKINATIKTVNIGNGKINNVYTEQFSREGNIGGVWGITGRKLFINRYYRYNGLETFNLDTTKEKTALLKFYDSVSFTDDNTFTCAFDSYTNNASEYRGYYNINKYAGIPTSSSTPTTLYKQVLAGGCAATFAPGNGNVYFGLTSFDANEDEITTVYKGTAGCKACQVPAPLFSVSGEIGGFTQNPSDDSFLYFGTEFGLFSYSKATAAITTLSNDTTQGSIVFYQGWIYYNNGNAVRAYNVRAKKTRVVNRNKVGDCKCNPGFTGDKCQTCDGQVQWDVFNNPTCVPLGSNGYPVTCTQDAQCGNSPYTYCDGACECQPNFTGPKCDQCAGNVTTTDGYPSCSVN